MQDIGRRISRKADAVVLICCCASAMRAWSAATCCSSSCALHSELGFRSCYARGVDFPSFLLHTPSAMEENVPTLNGKNVPEPLYKKLRARAKREGRSVAQEVIAILTRATEEPAPLSILALKGLGKEVWRGVDPAAYVEEERRTWD